MEAVGWQEVDSAQAGGAIKDGRLMYDPRTDVNEFARP